MVRRTIQRLAVLAAATSASWLGLALACYGPFYATIHRVYTDFGRAIVQIQCGRPVPNELIYTLAPGTCRFRNAEFDTELRIDADGFRNAPAHLGSGATSVAVLGDSFAMGWGVQQDEKLATLLAKDPGLRVRDLSMSSFGTVRELFALVRFSPRANVVILQHCANDAAENAAFLADPDRFAQVARRQSSEYRGLRAFHANRSPEQRVLRTMLDRMLGALASTWRLLALSPREALAPSDQVLDREARLFAGVIARFRKHLAGKRVIVFDVYAHGVREAAPEAIRRALREVDMGHVRVVDLAGLIDPGDYFHLDDHLNARGHAKLAGRLLEEIRLSGRESRGEHP